MSFPATLQSGCGLTDTHLDSGQRKCFAPDGCLGEGFGRKRNPSDPAPAASVTEQPEARKVMVPIPEAKSDQDDVVHQSGQKQA